jgi:predicted Zn finger-like uncharacterized protein
MALATRCSACSTVFRISTAQAAAKGGMVRCGQCRNVFNSLDALVRVEDLEVIDEIAVQPAAPPEVDERAPVTATKAGGVTGQAEELQEHEPTVFGFEAEERTIKSEWWLPEPAAKAEARSDELAREPAAGQRVPTRETESQEAATDLESPSFMKAGKNPRPVRRRARWAFGVLTLIALLGLLGQATYLWRDELAARWSPARAWLTTACEALQCTVDYPAHLDAITIESAAIKTGGPDLNVYELTALLRNRDVIDVRYPHLELVLTDLQDRPVLRRALRPEDYLSGRDSARSVSSGFPAESELPIHVMFELSDLRFTGFRVERFYP